MIIVKHDETMNTYKIKSNGRGPMKKGKGTGNTQSAMIVLWYY